MTTPYYGVMPDPIQAARANQAPMLMGGGLGGLGAIPMGPPPAAAAVQQPQTMGQVLASAGGNMGSYLSNGGQGGTAPGSNLIAQLMQKHYGTPGDQWNTQTIPAGSAHDWLNWVFNR